LIDYWVISEMIAWTIKWRHDDDCKKGLVDGRDSDM